MAHTILDDLEGSAALDDAGSHCFDLSGGALVHVAT